MPYELHPSRRLVDLFREKPWQGCDPAAAKFLFVGLDANYAADIERSLPEVFDYHSCGVSFWKKHGVHHPLLLPHYHGSGKKYHKSFSHIGFTPIHAGMVSFVELLHLPTVGVNKLSPQDLSPKHLDQLANLFENGGPDRVFMSSGVANLLRQTGCFPWLPRQPKNFGALGVLRERQGQTIYQMYHLSCYGWQSTVLEQQLNQIRGLLAEV